MGYICYFFLQLINFFFTPAPICRILFSAARETRPRAVKALGASILVAFFYPDSQNVFLSLAHSEAHKMSPGWGQNVNHVSQPRAAGIDSHD